MILFVFDEILIMSEHWQWLCWYVQGLRQGGPLSSILVTTISKWLGFSPL